MILLRSVKKKVPNLLPLSKMLPLFTVLLLVTSTAADLVPCKKQCDGNFTRDAIIENPGIVSVCHRGCELFTVALISMPRGGIPLLGFGLPFPFESRPFAGPFHPNLAALNGILPVNVPDIKFVQPKERLTELLNSNGISNFEKAKKEKHELDQEIAHKMDVIGSAEAAAKDSIRLRNIMNRMNEEKNNIMIRFTKIRAEKAEKEKKEKNAGTSKGGDDDTVAGDKKSEDIKNITKKEKPTSIIKHISTKTVHNKLPQKDNEVDVKSSIPRKLGMPFPTLRGEKARELLKSVRDNEKHAAVAASVTATSSQAKLHGPVPLPRNEKETKSEIKIAKHSKSDVPALVSEKLINAGSEIQKIKTGNSHGTFSKTTVQPIPHPVQDHPVHANRQITTDSSDADERKTTTPQTSNPVAPESHKIQDSSVKILIPGVPEGHRIQEFGVFSRLASKLGSVDSPPVVLHPFLRVSFMQPKPLPFGGVFLPQQINIIEIVKKKNSIDFEKLHQDHIKQAAGCPKIHERFEEAKHSCRHACATAYNIAQEETACVVGCQIQAITSSSQVKKEHKNTTKKHHHHSTTTPASPLPVRCGMESNGDVIVHPAGGLFSRVSVMFSHFAGQLGDSMHSFWSFVTNKEKEGNMPQIVIGEEEISTNRPELPELPIDIPKESKALALPSSPHLGVKIVIRENHRIIHSFPRLRSGSLFVDSFFRFTSHKKTNPKTEVVKIHNEQREVHNKVLDFKDLFSDKSPWGVNLDTKVKSGWMHDSQSEGEFFKQAAESLLKTFGEQLNEEEPSKKLSAIESLSISLYKILNQENGKPKIRKSEELEMMDGSSFGGLEDMKITTPQQHQHSISSVQIQPLDILDCISRKSGLPRWFITITVFSSALVVFWLCFTLSTPIDDSKSAKPKPTTVVMCEEDEEEDILEVDYCEKKKLLPAVDNFQISVRTV